MKRAILFFSTTTPVKTFKAWPRRKSPSKDRSNEDLSKGNFFMKSLTISEEGYYENKLMFGAYLACFMVLLSDAKTQTQAQETGQSAPAARIIEAKFACRLNAGIHAQSLEAPDEHKWLMHQIRISDDSSR